MYIKVSFFQMLHYYFFFMGILSFYTAFLHPSTSIFLIFFYITHSSYSWHITWYFYTQIRDIIVINPFAYILRHLILTVVACASMFFLYSFFLMETLAFTIAIVQLNFYVFFMATCWYVIAKFSMLNRLFSVKEEIKIDYSEPISEGVEMKILRKKLRIPRKIGGFGFKKPEKRNPTPDMNKDYQIDIYQSRISSLEDELKKSKSKMKADFCRKRILEYKKKIRSLQEK